jgi:hypothetical protein
MLLLGFFMPALSYTQPYSDLKKDDKALIKSLARKISGQDITDTVSYSGFKRGDKELSKFLWITLSHDFIDTVSYCFITAALIFNDKGNIEAVKFMNESDSSFKSYLTAKLLDTKLMWDTSVTKNSILLIPFEIYKVDDNRKMNPAQNYRMLSQEFLDLFKEKYVLRTTMLDPIITVTYPHQRKKGAIVTR